MHNEAKVRKLIGARIRAARESRGISQREFARMTFQTQPNVCNIENGERKITVDRLVEFSKVLRKPLLYFLSDL